MANDAMTFDLAKVCGKSGFVMDYAHRIIARRNTLHHTTGAESDMDAALLRAKATH